MASRCHARRTKKARGAPYEVGAPPPPRRPERARTRSRGVRQARVTGTERGRRGVERWEGLGLVASWLPEDRNRPLATRPTLSRASNPSLSSRPGPRTRWIARRASCLAVSAPRTPRSRRDPPAPRPGAPRSRRDRPLPAPRAPDSRRDRPRDVAIVLAGRRLVTLASSSRTPQHGRRDSESARRLDSGSGQPERCISHPVSPQRKGRVLDHENAR